MTKGNRMCHKERTGDFLSPFVKWPGGKRQLLPTLLSRVPPQWKEYHEPFLGGGALFLALRPRIACLIDSNRALMNAWKAIRDNSDGVVKRIGFLDSGIEEGGEAFYLQAREEFNRKLLSGENGTLMAAIFLFLNKHAFNGLYRVNRKGKFNVPWNGKTGRTLAPGKAEEIGAYLATSDIQLHCADFESLLPHVGPKDFVYLDPPCARTKSSSFRSYTEHAFLAEDQLRVAALVRNLDRLGARVMLTNSSTPFTKSLYHGLVIEEFPMRTSISKSAASRSGKKVLIVRNYK